MTGSLDAINATFELAGGLFIAASIVKLHRDKVVHGVSWLHVSFFTAWGLWNLIYYPALGQMLSFAGSVGITLANTIWLAQLIYYTRRPGGAEAPQS